MEGTQEVVITEQCEHKVVVHETTPAARARQQSKNCVSRAGTALASSRGDPGNQAGPESRYPQSVISLPASAIGGKVVPHSPLPVGDDDVF